MTPLWFRDPDSHDSSYSWDVDRIVTVFRNAGYLLRPSDARKAWEAYSASLCASWITLPEDDDQVFTWVMAYCETLDEAG